MKLKCTSKEQEYLHLLVEVDNLNILGSHPLSYEILNILKRDLDPEYKGLTYKEKHDIIAGKEKSQ